MKVAESAPQPKDSGLHVIKLPLGLLGFERIKDYTLVANPGEEPFLWLQVVNDPSLAFLVLAPHSVLPNYHPDMATEDAEFLQLRTPDDALIFNIVTMRTGQQATLNLKGPIVVNRHTLIGKQVIPLNAAEYSVQYPLSAIAS